jgi:hypothetical protein
MSNFGSLLSGQIQLPSGNNTSTSLTSTSGASSSSQTVSDINISPVGVSIDPSLYVYDGQTILLINSTVNQNNNQVQLQYFDPVTGYPSTGLTSPYGNPYPGTITPGFSNWNFDLTPLNNLNGCVTGSNLLGEQTYLYDNLQHPTSTANYLGLYSIDIANANQQTPTGGNSTSTMFFSLTSQPYLSYQGKSYNSPGVQGAPTSANINPNYSTLGTDSFLFTSQYWMQTSNEIILVYMVFNIANTSSTYFNVNTSPAITSSPAPIITVTVYNKIITREMLASVGTGNNCPKPKVYSTGTISLQYLPSGETFNSGVPSQFLFNNVPVIIADGYKKTFATMGIVYVPPSNGFVSGASTLNNNCQFLAANTIAGTSGGLSNTGNGFTITNYLPTGDITNLNLWSTTAGSVGFPAGTTQNGIGVLQNSQTLYGHFVVTVSYSYNSSQYNPGTAFVGEVLIKNIWRSPIAIYNAYSAFSVNDLINKQVVLLFGKSANGGTFLVTNTGTPLSQITNYGVTSLGNFMSIIKTVMTVYNNNYSLSDYFTNTTLINNLNTLEAINIQVVPLQPILEGTISNPPSVLSCPNMWYLFLNSKNSQNLSIDPTNQNVFNSNSSLYLGLNNSTLSDAGLCKYYNNELIMLGTTEPNTSNAYYFGNTLYLGLNVINSQSYYMLVVLPEALFNGAPLNTTNNVMSIYASQGTIFYFNYNSSSSSAFLPSLNSVSTSTQNSSSSGSGSTSNTYFVSKITLPVSNVQLL